MTDSTERAAAYVSVNYIKAYNNETLDELSLGLWLDTFKAHHIDAVVDTTTALDMASNMIEQELGFIPDEDY